MHADGGFLLEAVKFRIADEIQTGLERQVILLPCWRSLS